VTEVAVFYLLRNYYENKISVSEEDNMKRNMGLADRIIRVALALTVAILYFTNQLSLPAASRFSIG
jgi:hypothetical protein